VRHSSITNAVIGERTTIEHAQLHDAFLGDRVMVRGVKGSMNLGDDSDIRMDT
jgi:hypothetical protein